jgi:hypothetical protein
LEIRFGSEGTLGDVDEYLVGLKDFIEVGFTAGEEEPV